MVSYVELSDAYSRSGDATKAMAAAERAIELSGRAVAAIGVSVATFSKCNDVARARELTQELTERADHGYVFPFWLAVAHAAIGEMDKAYEYLAKAQEDRDPNLLYMSAVPRVIGWQPDPRYKRTMQAIGLGHLL